MPRCQYLILSPVFLVYSFPLSRPLRLDFGAVDQLVTASISRLILLVAGLQVRIFDGNFRQAIRMRIQQTDIVGLWSAGAVPGVSREIRL